MMNKIKQLALITLLLSSFSICAQTRFIVSGFVKDSVSAEPLIGVAVIDDRMRGTVTNEYGFFSLTVKDTLVELAFTYLGYKTEHYKAKIGSDIELNMLLAPSNLEIGEARVVANTNKFATTRDLGATLINSQQLKFIPSFMGEKDIFKYFQLLPGVQPGKEGSSGMNLRGGSTDQTLILMDDIPIYNSAHAFGFVSIFSGDYIKSAELYKGYVPPQYGGRLSGVATMTIREGNRKEHNQSIQLGTTTFSALVEGPINGGKGSYLVGGRYFMPHLLLQSASALLKRLDVLIPVVGFYDITAKMSYDLGKKSTIYASFYTGRDAISFAGYDSYYKEEKKVVSHYKAGINFGNIVGSVRLSSKLNNKTFFDLTTYYSHLSNNNFTESSEDDQVHDSNTKSKMDEVGVKATMQHNINTWYGLSYGANFSYQHFVPQDIFIDRDGVKANTKYGFRRLYTGNLFIDNNFTFNKFRLNLGGRISLYSNSGEQKVVAEPRVSLTYSMKKSSIWASYVINSQPLFSMTQQSYMPIDYWIPFQNANELPTSQQLSLGYKHNFDFGLEFQAETYYKKSKNLSIVYNIDDFLLEDGGYKLATGDAYGVELLAQYNYKRFNIMASYAYSRSLHHIDGKTINFLFDTPHSLNILTSYETLRRKNKTHTASVNVGYRTGLPYFLSNEAFPREDAQVSNGDRFVNYPVYPNTRLTNFFRLDLNYTMEKKLKKGSRIWQISLLNATAHRNPYVVYYNKSYNYSKESYDGGGYKAFSIIPIMPSFSYTRKF